MIAVLAVVMLASPAQAQAPASISLTNASYSQGYVRANMENNFSGSRYDVTVFKGQSVGEIAGAVSSTGTSEPEGYYTTYGWCSRWQVNGGAWSGTYGTGWAWINPGEGYNGVPWRVLVYTWDC
jgi:hypothetical protein